MQRDRAPESRTDDEKEQKRQGPAPGRTTLVQSDAARAKSKAAAKPAPATDESKSEGDNAKGAEQEAEREDESEAKDAGENESENAAAAPMKMKPRWGQLASVVKQHNDGTSKDDGKDAGATQTDAAKAKNAGEDEKGAEEPKESKGAVKEIAEPAPAMKDASTSSAKDANESKDAGAKGEGEGQEAKEAGQGVEAKEAGEGKEAGDKGPDGKPLDANHKPAQADPTLAKKGSIEVHTEIPVNGITARTMVGVGEKVKFKDSKDGAWSTTGGNGGASGNELDWTAPARPDTVKISHGDKHLEMKVVAPTGIDFKKRHALPVPSAGAGMRLNLTFLPLNVSFANVEWSEQGSGAEGVDGYFKEYSQRTGETLYHDPTGGDGGENWQKMGPRNNSVDDVARTQAKPAPYKEGNYHWKVPNKYRVKGEADGPVFSTVTQAFHMDPAGTVTVTKGGQSSSQKADGIIADDGKVEKFASVDEVLHWVNDNPKLYTGGAGKLTFLMRWIQNAKANKADPESIQHVTAAMNRLDLYVYLSVCCTNSYAWVGDDEVTTTLEGNGSGFSNTQSVPTSKDRKNPVSMEVPINQAFNLASWTPGVPLSLTLKVKEHVLTHSLSFPYDTGGEWTDLNGAGRYSIKMFVKERAK